LLALLSGAVTSSAAVFAVGFAFVGGALGVSYMCGITYALQAGPEGRGKRAGLHEGIMGLGLVSGPLLGGLAGQYVNLHAPFVVGAGMFAAGLVAMLILWRRSPA
ncbi:MAG: hypothetical protein KKI08_19310, partial [Armatimonadetes bacterium]|nr:hypothetical protein [Armatimonadota bacterium]